MGDRQSVVTFRRVTGVILILGVCWLITREVLQSHRKKQALAVVQELGGRMGGIPLPFFGDEIRITFRNRDLSEQDLQKLTVLNPLTGRNWVGVAFVDTNLSREGILELRSMLPRCVVFRVVDGQVVRDE